MAKRLKVIYVGGLDWVPLAPDHLGIKQGAKWMNWDFKVVDPILNDPPADWLVKECVKFKPDFIIHGNTDSITKVICPAIKVELPNTKQVFWMLDYRPDILEYDGFWPTWEQNKSGLDHIFISNYGQLKLWAEKMNCSSSFLPHGCWVIKPRYDKKYYHKVLFIGGNTDSYPYNKRVELLSELLKLVEFDWLNETENDKRNEVWTIMPEVYHTSDIVLDISHFWDNPGYASGRYWYTAGLGGCSVTKRFPGYEEFYQDKKHKWYFDTPQEASDIIKWLLKHPSVIKKTKKLAWEHNKKYHNYKVRFTQMLKDINL